MHNHIIPNSRFGNQRQTDFFRYPTKRDNAGPEIIFLNTFNFSWDS